MWRHKEVGRNRPPLPFGRVTNLARDGAGVVYLSIHHPDIVNFLSVRKENADEKVRIKTLSLGLTVTDKYYELVAQNKDMYLFSPHDVEKEYGKPFSEVDITAEYDKMVANDNIRKSKVNARELEEEISNLQNESGYPYIINIDTVNDDNPIDGRVLMSNLCTEVFQSQLSSKLNNDQTYEVLGSDVSCNLGSTNMTNLMESKENFGKYVKTMLRALTYVTDKSDIDVVPTIKEGNNRYHSVGLGAMDVHGFLAKNQIHYGSPEAIEIVDVYYMLLNYWTLVESNNMAMERQEKFFDFEKSTYADGSYFRRYFEKLDGYTGSYDFKFKNSKAKEVFEGIMIPNIMDWSNLQQSIIVGGLYHALTNNSALLW